MRKQTTARTRKRPTVSSSKSSGLIGKVQKGKPSARAKPALDNRSHRTITGSRLLDHLEFSSRVLKFGARNRTRRRGRSRSRLLIR